MFPENYLLPLLIAMSEHRGDTAVTFNGDSVLVGGSPIGDCPDSLKRSVFDARVCCLIQEWLPGVDVHIDAIERSWRSQIANGSGTNVRQLIDLARKDSSQAGVAGDRLDAWRRRLVFILENAGCHSVNQPDESKVTLGERNRHALVHTWPDRLLDSEEYAFAPTPFDFETFRGLPLDNVWVELYLATKEDVDRTVGISARKSGDYFPDHHRSRRIIRQGASEPVDFLLNTLSGLNIVIGDPGSGKSTLVKWLARRTLTPEGRFLLPLVLPLREFAIANDREQSLLQYGLTLAGISTGEQRADWATQLSLLAKDGDHVLLLLDGWDEIPDSLLTPKFIRTVRDLAAAFTVVLTSRPSGARLSELSPHAQFEIAELQPNQVDDLITKWHNAAKRPENHGIELRRHLRNHPDIALLTQNPFLLTCCCAVGTTSLDLGRELPATRRELYDKTIALVDHQHNTRCDKHHGLKKFNNTNRGYLRHLAYWLFTEAPKAPRYLFDSGDVTAITGDPDFFAKTLEPSRFISNWNLDDETYHFTHTTFQEYFAAKRLIEDDDKSLSEFVKKNVLNLRWQEVLAFIAAEDSAQSALWAELKELLKSPDKFGLVYVRAARFIHEARAASRSKQVLGIDLGEALKDQWKKSKHPGMTPFFDVTAELCPSWFDQQVASLKVRPVHSLRVLDVEKKDDNEVLVGTSSDEDLRKKIASLSSIPLLSKLALERPALAPEIVTSIALRGGHEAFDELKRLSTQVPSAWSHTILAIGYLKQLRATRYLLTQLSRFEPEDNRTQVVLTALKDDHPIFREADIQVLVWLLTSGPAVVRRLAASVLKSSNQDYEVTESLVECARSDPDSDVRACALNSLRIHARPQQDQVASLQDIATGGAPVGGVASSDRSDEERKEALAALAVLPTYRCSDAFRSIVATCLVDEAVREVAVELCEKEEIGSYFEGQLIEICRSASESCEVRQHACKALGHLATDAAVDAMLDLLEDPNPEVAEAAAEAAVAAAPQLLIHEKSDAATAALREYAFRTQALVYEDHLIDSSGQRHDGPVEETQEKQLAYFGFGYNANKEIWELWKRHSSGKWRRRKVVDFPPKQHEYLIAILSKQGCLKHDDALRLEANNDQTLLEYAKRDRSKKRELEKQRNDSLGKLRRSIRTHLQIPTRQKFLAESNLGWVAEFHIGSVTVDEHLNQEVFVPTQ